MSVRLSVEVLKPRSLLIKLSLRTRGPKNYSGPRVLTFTFTSVFAQQLPLSMGEVFLGFGGGGGGGGGVLGVLIGGSEPEWEM